MIAARIAVLCPVLILFCTACGPADAPDESQDPFIAALHKAHEDGQTYEEIAERIRIRHYPGQPPFFNPYEDEAEPYEDEAEAAASEDDGQADENPEFAFFARLLNDVEFLKALRDRDCRQIRNRLAEPEAYREDGGFLAAFILEEGICVKRDPAHALELYRQYTDRGSNAVALARLGNLYLQGDGVGKDPQRAEELFERAAVEGATMYWLAKGVIERVGPVPGDIDEVWGLSSMELQLRFADILTGPWDLPAPLQARIRWLDDLYADGGQRIAEIAMDMMSEGGNYDRDVVKAVSWMSEAGEFPGNDDYMFLAASWDMDPQICKLKQEQISDFDCEPDVRYAFWEMEQLALRGYPQAINLVFACYHASPKKDRTAWAWYQHVLSVQGTGSYLKSHYQVIGEARSGLEEFEQRIVEAWVRRMPDKPIRGYLPDATASISRNCPSDMARDWPAAAGPTSQR